MKESKKKNTLSETMHKHYESQLTKQKQLGEFYDKNLKELLARQEKLESLLQGTSLVQQTQKYKSQFDEQRSKTQVKSISRNIQIQKQSRILTKNEQDKQQSFDFQFQYNALVRSISKSLEQISSKNQQKNNKKLSQTTSRMTASVIQRKLKTSTIQPQVIANKSTLSPNKKIKKDSQMYLTQKEQLIIDFGSNSLLQSEDEIVNNLVQKLKQQEKKYIQGILTQTEQIIKKKIKSYLQSQVQKNEQILFKTKQKLIEKSLNKVSSNKQTMKSGYTQMMKQLVQNSLKNKTDFI